MNTRNKFKRYIKEKFGESHVQEALEKYDALGAGQPIGGIVETILFLKLVEESKDDKEE